MAGNTLCGSSEAAYFPTILALIQGPWQTEQESHGLLIIAASIWLVWQSRERLSKAVVVRSRCCRLVNPFVWPFHDVLVARTQGVLTFEAASVLPVIVGCVLLLAGWPVLRILAFPIGFLLFAVPMPDWVMIYAATVPLKVLISDGVTRVLYAADYPIAQNGVMIMIGPYQVLVKGADAEA